MPWDEVMHKWKAGKLHSGSKTGPPVTDHSQAVAIMLSEKKKAAEGNTEYQAADHPAHRLMRRVHVRRKANV